ncbi:MAG: polyprenyl synthetase family protein [Jatrophihabitans sp.]|uniref:polyprenyl synthetase family protein n=1 Tax=Jatrophihabitans sp. TaxID=1932789 RepID=UPI00390D7162
MTARGGSLIERVDTELAAFLDGRAAAFAALGSDLLPVSDAARSMVLDGGKRLRPSFAYWGWRTVRDSTDDDSALVTAAASLELLHACALVHDDVMDSSDTRRGRPAAHTAFARMHRDSGWTGRPEAFGTAAAILLGDLLLSWADAMFASVGLAPEVAAHARVVYDEMRQLVMAGQYLDVLVQARGAFSADEALRVIEFKTSKYTVEGPLHLGAAAAGAPPEVFAALTAYGLALGEAFQLRDDVLGVFGDPSVTGKPAGDDLREGKHTLLTALAMAAADAEQSQLLRDSLGDRDLDDDQVERLRGVIVATGALVQVEHRISARTDAARTALSTPAIGEDARAALDALARAATERHA